MSLSDNLLVIWSTAEREVALCNIFMYTYNSRAQGWWQNVRLLIWGPSGKLLVEDQELQGRIKEMLDSGIEVIACVGCAKSYGIVDQLSAIGVDVIPAGQPLTDMLKSDWKILTY